MQDLVAFKGSDENDPFGFSGSVKHRFSINNNIDDDSSNGRYLILGFFCVGTYETVLSMH